MSVLTLCFSACVLHLDYRTLADIPVLIRPASENLVSASIICNCRRSALASPTHRFDLSCGMIIVFNSDGLFD